MNPHQPLQDEDPVFSQLFSGLDYPLYVLTTAVNNEPTGCLIGFATQCSIHPPRFLACLSKKNHTFALAELATRVAVHVIEEDTRHLAELFGRTTGDEIDKFARVRWHSVEGVPVLEDCRRWFTASVLTHIEFGDHVGHLLEPHVVVAGPAATQLTFQQARDIEPGHEP